MRILGNNSAKLNEIIFANRNKSYGAYAIRSAYNDSLIKSLAYLAGILICIFGISTYLNRNNSTSDKGVLLLDDVKPEYVIEYTVEPKQPEVVQPVINEPAAAAPSGGTPIIVDYNVVTTTSLNLNNPINGLGTATATGISTTGTATTSNTLVATSPSVDIVDNSEHIIVEEMPEFNLIPNGVLVYVSSNITYPPLAREIGREGTVHVSFVVNQLGEVEGVKILKGIGYGCDEEVLRVINKMPNWKKPGKNNGKPVKVRYNIPVSFRLK
jgi:protein TonB